MTQPLVSRVVNGLLDALAWLGHKFDLMFGTVGVPNLFVFAEELEPSKFFQLTSMIANEDSAHVAVRDAQLFSSGFKGENLNRHIHNSNYSALVLDNKARVRFNSSCERKLTPHECVGKVLPGPS